MTKTRWDLRNEIWELTKGAIVYNKGTNYEKQEGIWLGDGTFQRYWSKNELIQIRDWLKQNLRR